MKFTMSTKPLADALNLGVIPGNISKYYKVSCLAQLTASQNELRVNLEAAGICTELLLKGKGDSDEETTAFVDCLSLKQIVGTFDSPTVTIEFIEGGVVLHAGSSRCTLSELADSEDGELRRPQLPDPSASKAKLDLADWRFIKDYQMYAIALSFAHPIYMKVWIGESGDVVVGDFDNSLFTFSKKNKLGRTCLLSDTIINLFTSLPEGADITLMDTTYRVGVKTDSFEYAAELTPEYEGQGTTGDYRADAIMATAEKDPDKSFKVPIAPLSTFFNQADILSSGTSNTVTVTLKDSDLEIKDENVNVKLKVDSSAPDFEARMNMKLLYSVIGHQDTETVSIQPVIDEGVTQGLIVWTDNLTVVVGAEDEGEA